MMITFKDEDEDDDWLDDDEDWKRRRKREADFQGIYFIIPSAFALFNSYSIRIYTFLLFLVKIRKTFCLKIKQ